MKELEQQGLVVKVRVGGGNKFYPKGQVPEGSSVVLKEKKEKRLTPREKEVLELVAQGLSNAEIADELVIAEDYVRCLFMGARKHLEFPPVGSSPSGGTRGFYKRRLETLRKALELGEIEVDPTPLQKRANIPFTERESLILQESAKPQTRKEIARALTLRQQAENGVMTTEIDEYSLKFADNSVRWHVCKIAKKLRELGKDIPAVRGRVRTEDLNRRLAILRAAQEYLPLEISPQLVAMAENDVSSLQEGIPIEAEISPQLVAMAENDVSFRHLKTLELMAEGRDTPFALAWRLGMAKESIGGHVRRLCRLNPRFAEAKKYTDFSQRCHCLVKIARELGILPTDPSHLRGEHSLWKNPLGDGETRSGETRSHLVKLTLGEHSG